VDEIRTEAQQVFRDVFGDDDIVLRDDMTADDVDGWDSTAHINLIVALEKQFKVKFAMAEISRMKDEDQNVGGLLRLIAKKLGKAG
jgi:acyl carrier protein